MRRSLLLTMIILFILLFVTACGQVEPVIPTRAALAEVAVPTDQSRSEAVVIQPVGEIAPETGAEVDSRERPLLPNLATGSVEGGVGANLNPSPITAESVPPAEGLPLVTEIADVFEETTFELNAPLPANTATAQVWQQAAMPLDINRAKAIAKRWGFTSLLYQLATPDDSIVSEPISLDAAQLPTNLPEFHVFDGTRSLVITEGAAYYSDESVPFNFETPRPFSEIAPMTEAALQSMNLLDFPYTLADGWGHEVWVYRELDGLATNYPEISAGMGENGRLAFASYQPLDNLASVGTYPLISAEAAWSHIQDGIDEDILFSITPAPEDEQLSESLLSGFQYWPREHQNGEEVHLYTYPTVFLPIEEESPPLIHALNYSVQTDDGTRQALAEQVGKNVHIWGILDTSSNSLALAGWEPAPDLNPLIKNGFIRRQGEQTLLRDQSGGVFILPNAPADLADGSGVNVFAWAERDTGQAYPMLDWEGIDMQIAGGSGEAGAIPALPASPLYDQVSINDAQLAYYVFPEMVMGENGRSQQLHWLLPVWQFAGIANNGDMVTFTVQATE